MDETSIKVLDNVEHDSLETITTSATNTSSESKRSENVLKALERRYHLLYLNAIEIQCMFEGLLEKRNFFDSANHEQKSDTSDEGPIAKIRKIGSSTKFTSIKATDEACSNNIDGDLEDSFDEMECSALKGLDCVDSKIVPVTPSKEESLSLYATPNIVKKRSKDFSKFNRSNRKSKNCAIFYYKHIDSDNDPAAINENNNLASETSEEEIWEYANAVQSSSLNEIKDMTHPLDLIVNKSNDAASKIDTAPAESSLSKTSQVNVTSIKAKCLFIVIKKR